MFRLTTYVTSSPTTSRRRSSAIRASSSSAAPSALNSASGLVLVLRLQQRGRVLGGQPAGPASDRPPAIARPARRRHVRGHLGPVAVDRVEVAAAVARCGPSVSIVACRSVRPDRDASSGSCHGRPAGSAASSGQPGRRVGQRRHVRGEPRVEPALAAAHVLRVDGQPLAQLEARPRRTCARSSSICGQGRSGLTWSGVTGETPPQSSMPARSSRSNSRVDQVRRGLDAGAAGPA